jgi:hypothetical protein
MREFLSTVAIAFAASSAAMPALAQNRLNEAQIEQAVNILCKQDTTCRQEFKSRFNGTLPNWTTAPEYREARLAYNALGCPDPKVSDKGTRHANVYGKLEIGSTKKEGIILACGTPSLPDNNFARAGLLDCKNQTVAAANGYSFSLPETPAAKQARRDLCGLK